jgi:hypothetical protein
MNPTNTDRELSMFAKKVIDGTITAKESERIDWLVNDRRKKLMKKRNFKAEMRKMGW